MYLDDIVPLKELCNWLPENHQEQQFRCNKILREQYSFVGPHRETEGVAAESSPWISTRADIRHHMQSF